MRPPCCHRCGAFSPHTTTAPALCSDSVERNLFGGPTPGAHFGGPSAPPSPHALMSRSAMDTAAMAKTIIAGPSKQVQQDAATALLNLRRKHRVWVCRALAGSTCPQPHRRLTGLRAAPNGILGRVGARPLLSGWLILYRGGGGQRPKRVCVPKIDLQVRAPLINFIFFLRKNFLMWVGGWVSQNPGGPI